MEAEFQRELAKRDAALAAMEAAAAEAVRGAEVERQELQQQLASQDAAAQAQLAAAQQEAAAARSQAAAAVAAAQQAQQTALREAEEKNAHLAARVSGTEGCAQPCPERGLGRGLFPAVSCRTLHRMHRCRLPLCLTISLDAHAHMSCGKQAAVWAAHPDPGSAGVPNPCAVVTLNFAATLLPAALLPRRWLPWTAAHSAWRLT